MTLFSGNNSKEMVNVARLCSIRDAELLEIKKRYCPEVAKQCVREGAVPQVSSTREIHVVQLAWNNIIAGSNVAGANDPPTPEHMLIVTLPFPAESNLYQALSYQACPKQVPCEEKDASRTKVPDTNAGDMEMSSAVAQASLAG